MITMSINSAQIYNAFISGAQTIIQERQSLNELNVFPVADGDTGNNMASTMDAIIRQSKPSNSMRETLQSITDAVSLNARGNSGAILAQFIIGFSESCPDQELSDRDFIDGLKIAVAKVYAALSHPVEGTIITVMRLWVAEIDALYQKGNDLKTSIDLAFNKAQEVLRDTPNLLKVLKDHHVVDSGAKGFVHFVEGFMQGLWNTLLKVVNQEEVDFDESHLLDADEEIHYRYCTEALLEHPSKDTKDLKVKLDALGDSLLIVTSQSRTKIHIHTNHPDEVMEVMRSYGDIIQQKAEDMRIQHADFKPEYPIALLTDSIADLPKSILLDGSVHILPLTIMVGRNAFIDRLTLSAQRLYSQVSDYPEYPSSSQPNEKVVSEIYRSLLRNYEQVLVVSVSSKMSGTHDVLAKTAKAFGNKVVVVDSRRNSAAQGLLVLSARKFIEQGYPLETIVGKLEALRLNTQIFVSVDTLKYMVKMGRVSPVVGKVAKLVNLKPVVSIDDEGKGITIGSAFNKHMTEKRMLKEIDAMIKGKQLIQYAIVHGNDKDRAEYFADHLTKKFKQKPEFIEEISTIVAMSAGPKTFAIALQVEPQ